MGTGEKVEASVYMAFLLIGILVLLFVMGSMAGMVVTGGCEIGAVDANGHSACYNDAWEHFDSTFGVDSNPRR